jgi:dsRNA-specific ribonuclease
MYNEQNYMTNNDQFIDPYNDYNKLITLYDIKIMFKKFDIDVNPVNINYYINALTHKSYIKKEYYDIHINQMTVNMKFKSKNTLELLDNSNERLEFLGDTVIKCVVSGYLFLRYQYEDEGFMTRLKTKIEDRKSLAIFAKKLGLDEYMIISKQIEDNNGRNSEKLLEDCFESFVGALYLDVGFEVCRQFMYIILETEIEYSELLYKDTNYKDQLLRFYHQNKWSYPRYVKINDENNEINCNNQKILFTMGVKDHNGNIVAKAKASSKREAEQLASMYALYYFKVINEDQLVCTIDMS